MINAIKPGMIKLDKVYKNPIHSHEISSNIKLLMLALEKLNLDFKIEVHVNLFRLINWLA